MYMNPLIVSPSHEQVYSYYLSHFTEPYQLYAGCKQGNRCNSGKTCISENKCPNGCSFSKCLQIARSGGADGFSFRSTHFSGPFCKMCTRIHLGQLQPNDNSGVYTKRGKHIFSFGITKCYVYIKIAKLKY